MYALRVCHAGWLAGWLGQLERPHQSQRGMIARKKASFPHACTRTPPTIPLVCFWYITQEIEALWRGRSLRVTIDWIERSVFAS